MFDPTRMSLHPPGALWFAITCSPSTKNGIFHEFHPTENFSTPPLKKMKIHPWLFKIKLCYSKSNCLIQNRIILFKIRLCYSKSNCVIQNQIVSFKIESSRSKSNRLIQNQIVLFKIKLCYAKSDCVMQNQIVLCKIKLCYAKSNWVIQNQIVLFKFKRHKMSARITEFVFQLST